MVVSPQVPDPSRSVLVGRYLSSARGAAGLPQHQSVAVGREGRRSPAGGDFAAKLYNYLIYIDVKSFFL